LILVFLKNDIIKLYPEIPPKNLDLFSPITQLKTKMNYMSGKMGVALTANQLVDHVANQSLSISMKTNLGLGNTRYLGKKAFTDMDRASKGRSIATTLSAFLNAYVDIAKDPYVTRNNHNDVTANITFMLIRAGVSLEKVNRIIGQPILKEYVELIKRQESITASPLTITVDDVTKFATPYEFLRHKYKLKTADDKNIYLNQLGKINNKRLEEKKKGNQDKIIDEIFLNAFEHYEEKAAQWTAAVLSTKIDVKGAGGSPVTMNIAINKIDKISKSEFVFGYDSKFKDTALEAYESALEYTRAILSNSNILLSATNEARTFMNTAASQITREDTLLSEELGKALNRGMYSYLMSSSSIMKDNRMNFDYLFKKLPNEIGEMKLSSDNFLIQELEIDAKGGYKFLGINNKNKPAQYENNIYRAWMELYENPTTKDLAVNLVRYAYSQSGFQMNLNQFFTHIPHEILKSEGVNAEVDGFFGKLGRMEMDTDGFLDQFYRHESNNTDVVPRINNSDTKGEDVDRAYGFSASDSFLKKYEKIEDGIPQSYPPKFVTLNLGDDVIGLFKITNSITPKGNPIYARTFKLGYKAGKNRVFEYSYENNLKKSVLDQNSIDKDFIKGIKLVNEKLIDKDSSQENFEQEERYNDDYIEEDTVTFREKVARLQEAMDVLVIMDETVPTSRVLGKNEKRVKEAGNHVIHKNPNQVFKTTAINEFGHIFIDSFPNGLDNPRLQKALNMLMGTELEREVREMYPELNDEMFAKKLYNHCYRKKKF